jgi:Uma2 family endonuclease
MLHPHDIAPDSVRPLTREQYDELVKGKLFKPGERIELLYGTLVEMSPQDPAHAQAIEQLHAALSEALGQRARIRTQAPFAASEDSEPEPDVLVFPKGDYTRSHPSSALLIVEVADSSIRKDREVKARLYAEAGVPEYWVVNLIDRVVERHLSPREGRYADVRRISKPESIQLVAFPDVSIPVAKVIPELG